MKVNQKDLEPLLELLSRTEIPINYHRGRKRDKEKKHGSHSPAGVGRTVLIGEIPHYKDKLSNFTKQHPEIYEAVKQLASIYVPFPVKSFMLNKNYQTNPHYDAKNKNDSVIFSFGDYTGGELVVEGVVVPTYLQTFSMNGSKKLHWNLPITSGTKYSLIFFNT